jgi:3-phosphoshikimate 1-carboxyvinyltransferase
LTDLVIRPDARQPLRGVVAGTPHRGIATCAVLLGALGSGATITGRGLADLPILAALRAMGVTIDDGLEVHGVGLRGLVQPLGALDHGASADTLALLAGVLAAMPFPSRLEGDAAIARAHLHRVVVPLRRRGAEIEGRLDPATPQLVLGPLEIRGGRDLAPLELELPLGDIAGKQAALVSALYAAGDTLLHERIVCGEALPRMLSAAGAPVESAGAWLKASPPPAPLARIELEVPAELDAALVLAAAALAVPGSVVGTRQVAVNPADAAALAALRDAGFRIAVEPRGERAGQQLADVIASAGSGAGIALAGERMLQAGCSTATAAVWAAHARGESLLGVGTVDPRPLLACLAAFGVDASREGPHLRVRGATTLRAAEVDAQGDAGVAMAATVLALAAGAPSRVRGADCIVARFPRFVGSLRALGAAVDVVS